MQELLGHILGAGRRRQVVEQRRGTLERVVRERVRMLEASDYDAFVRHSALGHALAALVGRDVDNDLQNVRGGDVVAGATSVERALVQHYSPHISTRTRALLHLVAADATTATTTTMTDADVVEPLPTRLRVLLVDRWQAVCIAADAPPSSHTTGVATVDKSTREAVDAPDKTTTSDDEHDDDDESTLTCYLRDALPAWCMLLDCDVAMRRHVASDVRFAECVVSALATLRDEGDNDTITTTLQQQQQHTARQMTGECGDDDDTMHTQQQQRQEEQQQQRQCSDVAVVTDTTRRALLLLHLLSLVHECAVPDASTLVHNSDSNTSNAVATTAQQARRLLQLDNAALVAAAAVADSDADDAAHAHMRATTQPRVWTMAVHKALLTSHLPRLLTMLSRRLAAAATTTSTRTTTRNDAVSVCAYAVAAVCALVMRLLSSSSSSAPLHEATVLAPNMTTTTTVSGSAAAVTVEPLAEATTRAMQTLLTRHTTTSSSSSTTVPCAPLPPSSLLRALSCLLVLTTRLLRAHAAVTAQVLGHSGVYDSLVVLLQHVGCLYARAATTATPRENSADGTYDAWRGAPLACDDAADELLYSVLGLLTACRRAHDSHTTTAAVDHLLRVELLLTKVLLSSPPPWLHTSSNSYSSSNSSSIDSNTDDAAAAQRYERAWLPASSCLYDMALAYAFSTLPPTASSSAHAHTNNNNSSSTSSSCVRSHRCYAHGLWHILLEHDEYASVVARDSRLRRGVLQLLARTLVVHCACKNSSSSRHEHNKSENTCSRAACDVLPSLAVVRETVCALVHALARYARSLRCHDSSTKTTTTTATTTTTTTISTTSVALHMSRALCGVLARALRNGGDNAVAVCDALVSCRGCSAVHVLCALAIAWPYDDGRSDKSSDNTPATVTQADTDSKDDEGDDDVCACACAATAHTAAAHAATTAPPLHVLALLLPSEQHHLGPATAATMACRRTLLLHNAVDVLRLVCLPHTRHDGALLLVRLFCHTAATRLLAPDAGTTATASALSSVLFAEYKHDMRELVTAWWGAVRCCVGVCSDDDDNDNNDDDTRSEEANNDNNSSSVHALLHTQSPGERDVVLLTLLQCVRRAVRRLRSGALCDCLTPARQLQHVLLLSYSNGSSSTTSDGSSSSSSSSGGAALLTRATSRAVRGDVRDRLTLLLHRLTQPWSPSRTTTTATSSSLASASAAARAAYGIRAVLTTLTCLVQGNASLRALLYGVVTTDELLRCMRVAWQSAACEDDGGGDGGWWWPCYVRACLDVVYEHASMEDDDEEEDTNNNTSNNNDGDNDVHATSRRDTACIQHVELLVSLLRSLLHGDEHTGSAAAADDDTDAATCLSRVHVRAALGEVLTRLLHTLRACRGDVYACARDGGVYTSLLSLVTPLYCAAQQEKQQQHKEEEEHDDDVHTYSKNSNACSTTTADERLTQLLDVVSCMTAHHISVRQLKQLLCLVAHAPHPHARRAHAVLVTRVLYTATRIALACHNNNVSSDTYTEDDNDSDGSEDDDDDGDDEDSATRRVREGCLHTPRNYLALCRGSGQVGVQALLDGGGVAGASGSSGSSGSSSSSSDGYTIALWVRLEASDTDTASARQQCIVSLSWPSATTTLSTSSSSSSSHTTRLALIATRRSQQQTQSNNNNNNSNSSTTCVYALSLIVVADADATTTTRSGGVCGGIAHVLDCAVYARQWTHITLQHRRASFLYGAAAADVHVYVSNSNSSTTTTAVVPRVPYFPALCAPARGTLWVGSTVEDVTTTCVRHALHAQVADVYVFVRVLSVDEVHTLRHAHCDDECAVRRRGSGGGRHSSSSSSSSSGDEEADEHDDGRSGSSGGASASYLTGAAHKSNKTSRSDGEGDDAVIAAAATVSSSSSSSMSQSRNAAGGGCNNTAVTATLLVGSLSNDHALAAEAVVCVDARVGECGRLYNAAALLRGRPRDSALVVYDGTRVCTASSGGGGVVDAMRVVGVASGVLMPLVAMLCDGTLPLSSRGLTHNNSDNSSNNNMSTTTTMTTADALYNVCDGDVVAALCRLARLVGLLGRVKVLHGRRDGGGDVCVLLAHALQLYGDAVDVRVPPCLASVCARLASHASLFRAAYMTFFLDACVLRACARDVRLLWLSCHRILVATHRRVRTRARAAGAQAWAVTTYAEALLHNNGSDDSSSRHGRDDGHADQECTQLLLLLEALTVSPVTMRDAVALVRLLHAARRHWRIGEDKDSCSDDDNSDNNDTRVVVDKHAVVQLVELLRRTRLLLCTRPAQLLQYLGMRAYAAALLPFVVAAPHRSVCHEAVLQLLLLTSHSRRTQEVMNAHLLDGRAAVHVLRDVDLAWLARVLARQCSTHNSIDDDDNNDSSSDDGEAAYMVLRTALLGVYDVRVLPTRYTPLSDTARTIAFTPLLAPLLLLPAALVTAAACAQLTSGSARHGCACHVDVQATRRLRAHVLADVATLLGRDGVHAWRQLLAVPGWYRLLIDLLQEPHQQQQRQQSQQVHTKDNDNNNKKSKKIDVADDKATVARVRRATLVEQCATVLSSTLYHALVHESCGVAELEAVVAYLRTSQSPSVSLLLSSSSSSSVQQQQQGQQPRHSLLHRVLCNIADLYRALLRTHAEAGQRAALGFGSAVALRNFAGFVYLVEDVLFYSSPAAAVAMITMTSAVRDGSDGAASTAAASAGGVPRLGYTERDQLMLRQLPPNIQTNDSEDEDEEEACVYVSGSRASDVDAQRALRLAPDGRWLHHALALKTASLLLSSAALVNDVGVSTPHSAYAYVAGNSSTLTTSATATAIVSSMFDRGSGGGDGGGGGVHEASSYSSGSGSGSYDYGNSNSGALELRFPSHVIAHRRGAFVRVVARLLRVCASMTLRSGTALRRYCALLRRFCLLLDRSSAFGFALLKRASSVDDCKPHSPLAVTLALMHSVRELLLRRLSTPDCAVVTAPQVLHNAELVHCLRRLAQLFPRAVAQYLTQHSQHAMAATRSSMMQHTMYKSSNSSSTTSTPAAAHRPGDRYVADVATAQWLCHDEDNNNDDNNVSSRVNNNNNSSSCSSSGGRSRSSSEAREASHDDTRSSASELRVTTSSSTTATAAAAATATAVHEAAALVHAFVEVASRDDCTALFERCLLLLEREQLTDKALASSVTRAQTRAAVQVADAVADTADARARLRRHLQQYMRSHMRDDKDGNNNSNNSARAATVVTAQRAAMWQRLRTHAYNSMWRGYSGSNTSKDNSSSNNTINLTCDTALPWSSSYVRLSLREQQPLVRRKLVVDEYGTNHRRVTTAATASSAAPPSSLPSHSAHTAGNDNDDDDAVTTHTPPRLRGGEEVLLQLDDTERTQQQTRDDNDTDNSNTAAVVEADAAVADTTVTATTAAATSAAPSLPVATVYNMHTQHDSSHNNDAAVVDDTMTTMTAAAVMLSVPCEVPYMMHCWSATFVVRHDGDVCVVYDEHNTAYNQCVADEALPYVVAPARRPLRFSAAHIALVAPGRRFRMRRTGIELWLNDRRSVFVKFRDVTVMRRVLVALCRAAAVASSASASGGGSGSCETCAWWLPPSLLLRGGGGGVVVDGGGGGLLLGSSTSGGGSGSVSGGGGCSGMYVLNENPTKEPLLLHCMRAWRERRLSSFDYLLWLNVLAGRSVNDVTQYPVFPWVVADYTSAALNLRDARTFRDLRLPMGLCGAPARAAVVRRRYAEMCALGDVPSHYFTHYSSPAVALYYLVRLEPYTRLQIVLQGGHFDHADRMFHSVAACYRGVVTSTQDVRELVPELYCVPELCRNHNDVHFGNKQDGEAMGDLQLPPWAHGSAHEFVYRLRAALECDAVSAALHHWVDLVFGYKQRGREAIAAANVYNWHAYEDVDRARNSSSSNGDGDGGSAIDQRLLIDSLDNIGQTPIQLFRSPHVERAPRELADFCITDEDNNEDDNSNSNINNDNKDGDNDDVAEAHSTHAQTEVMHNTDVKFVPLRWGGGGYYYYGGGGGGGVAMTTTMAAAAAAVVDVRARRVVRLAIASAERLVLVNGAGAATVLRLHVHPLRRRFVTLTTPPPPTAATAAAAGSDDGNSNNNSSALTTAATASATAMTALATEASARVGRAVARVLLGSDDMYSCDVSDDYELRMPAMPAGVLSACTRSTTAMATWSAPSPRDAYTSPTARQQQLPLHYRGSSNSTTAATAEVSSGRAEDSNNDCDGDGGVCGDNAALLCYDTETFVALGGLYDYSIVLRALSGLSDDVRLRAHRGRVVRLVASRDSRYLISAAEDTTFVVWRCALQPGRRHHLVVRVAFVIAGHVDSPTAADVSVPLDTVVTASRDGVVLLHTLGTGRRERAMRHPRGGGVAVHAVLLNDTCYVPHVLLYSHVDATLHQVALDGTLLRSVVAPGRVTSWSVTSQQYVLLACTPHTAAVATRMTQHGGGGAAQGDEAATRTGEALTCTSIVFVHAFFLTTLRVVAVPGVTTLCSVAAEYGIAPQAIVAGTDDDRVVLVRLHAPSPPSTMLLPFVVA